MLDYDASTEALFHSWRRPTRYALSAVKKDDAVWCEMARLAYTPFPPGATSSQDLNLVLKPAGFSDSSLFTFGATGSQAFGCLRFRDRLAVIAFRGTQALDVQPLLAALGIRSGSLLSVISSLIEPAIDVAVDAAAVLSPFRGGGRVHTGFQTAYTGLEAQLKTWLSTTQPAGLLLTGHSLGGALATIAASQLRSHLPGLQTTLVTFGSPRVGDAGFVATLGGLAMRRYVNCCDLVPRVPPALHALPYRHAGDLHYLDSEGQDRVALADEAIGRDQRQAAGRFLAGAACRLLQPGQLKFRDLADHTPINYLRALAPELR